MFGRTTEPTHGSGYRTQAVARDHYAVEPRARGGIAGGPILTGVMVAFGSMSLLLAVVGGVFVALGLADGELSGGEAIEAGIGAGMALVLAQFLAYLWGGYTAGRMARGAGLGNGLLVPLTALVVAALVGAVATGLGATANLNIPFSDYLVPLEDANLVDFGIGVGIASLVAMFLGGALGGALGARWHTKLEQAVAEERIEERRELDLREHDRTPATVGATTGGAAAQRPATSTTTPVEGGVDLTPEDRSTRTSRLHR